MRDISEYVKQYENTRFERYQAKYRRKKVLEIIERFNPERILEIGCGSEPLFWDLPTKLFTIIEPSSEFCRIAREHSTEKVNIIEGFFGEDVCLDAEFDMIICSSLLHEVEEVEGLLSAIRRVAQRDTIIHINVPNANSMHRCLAKESGLIEDVLELSDTNISYQQHRVFNMETLCEIVEHYGFRVIDKGGYFVKPFTHLQMQQLLDNSIIEERVLEGLYNIAQYMPDLSSEIYVNLKCV